MKIAVLAGGDSPEREVSLRSGRAVSSALKARGHRVISLDPEQKHFVRKLLKFKPDCVFIALHGGKGENGVIQGFLETLRIPYTGSGVLSSAICMNKLVTKKILRFHRLPTPDFMVVERAAKLRKLPFPLPVVVKPASLGSTIGIAIVRHRQELARALRACRRYDREVFLEKYVPGTEITVSILGNEKPEVLPVIQIKTPTGFYDYQAKYSPAGSIHQMPPDLPETVLKKARKISLDAYAVLKCRGLARMEIIVDRKGTPYILDVNTIPGFTETSLFPDSARAAGLSFGAACERLVKLAWKKKA